jgi:hypothetical protein
MSAFDPKRTSLASHRALYARMRVAQQLGLLVLAVLNRRPALTSKFHNQRKIAEFASHCDLISQGSFVLTMAGKVRIMSARIRRPIGSIAFVSALLASGLGVSVPANTARAVDCLTAPDSSAPQNSHWYYRIDRAQQRKCWYLRAADQPSQQGAVQSTREASMAHHIANLSDKDVEKLYAEFLEWSRRHAKN